jgi:hypothetical protein
MGFNMNRLLIVAILIIGILPLYAQSQQPDAAELAQKVVGIVGGDKTKTQTCCQVLDLSDELDQVDRQKDREKAEDLSRKINELQKTLGPEYLALLEAAKYVDPKFQRRPGDRVDVRYARGVLSALTRLSRTGIADEMREEHRRRVLGE